MGKASRARRLRREQRAAQQEMLSRVKQSLPEERIRVVKRRTGRKVSDILMEFATPWLDEARNEDQRKTVVGMAVLAWNMALTPEEDRWRDANPEFEKQLGDKGKALIDEMIARKLDLYPEEDRPILDYQITGEGTRMRVEVMYTLLPNEIQDLAKNDPNFAK